MKMWSGRFRQAARPRVRALAAVFRIRSPAVEGRTGGEPGPCGRTEECGRAVFRRTDHHSSRSGSDCAEGAHRRQFLEDSDAEDVHHFVEKQLVNVDRRYGLQAAQRPQPQRADRD